MKKEPQTPMFHYRIYWTGCNGAGEYEEGVEYDGNDRDLALAAIKKAKDWMSYYGELTVRGREKIKAEKERAERHREAQEWAEQYEAANGPDIMEFEDGTMAFDYDVDNNQLHLFETTHGKEVKRYRYWEYFYSLGVFSDKKVSDAVRTIHIYD